MKILLIGSPDKYEIKEIIKEFNLHNIEVEATHSNNIKLGIKNGIPLIEYNGKNINEFDGVFIRIGNRKNKFIIEYCKLINKFVFDNTPNILDKFSQYLLFSSNHLPTPTTQYIGNLASFSYFINSDLRFPLILKDIHGSLGKEVYLVNKQDEISNILKKNTNNEFLLQEVLGNREDVRVLVLDGIVLGGMLKKAGEGEFRTNIAQGGYTEKIDLSEEISNIAIEATKLVNLTFSGIDIIIHENKPYILEINFIPQFEGFQKTVGINIAKLLVDKYIEKYNKFYSL